MIHNSCSSCFVILHHKFPKEIHVVFKDQSPEKVKKALIYKALLLFSPQKFAWPRGPSDTTMYVDYNCFSIERGRFSLMWYDHGIYNTQETRFSLQWDPQCQLCTSCSSWERSIVKTRKLHLSHSKVWRLNFTKPEKMWSTVHVEVQPSEFVTESDVLCSGTLW